MNNTNNEVPAGMMNSIEKTSMVSNIGLDQIPGIQIIISQTSSTTTDTKIPCANDNINNIHDLPCVYKYSNITLSKEIIRNLGLNQFQ